MKRLINGECCILDDVLVFLEAQRSAMMMVAFFEAVVCVAFLCLLCL